MTLWRYILRGFLRATLAVFAVIALVIVLFSAVENLRRFGESGVDTGDVLRVTLLQAPEVLYQVFPLVLMLASLVTFLRFARTSELVVMRASGISALRLIAVPVVAALLLGVGFVAAVNPFVAASIKRGQALVDDIDGGGANLSFSKDGVWLRQADPNGGQSVIQAARTNADGTVLSQVRLFRFDDAGALYSRIEAPQARLTRGAWIMPSAVEWRLAPDGSFTRAAAYGGRLDLPTTLTSEEILESFAPPETVGFWDLGRFIAQMEEFGLLRPAAPSLPADRARQARALRRHGADRRRLRAAPHPLRPDRRDDPARRPRRLRPLFPQGLRRIARRTRTDPADRRRLDPAGGGDPARARPPPAPRGRLMRRRRLRLAALGLVVAATLLPAGAQRAQELPASLIADQVTYDRDTRLLTATGNVEVLYQGRVLRAHRIVYDEAADEIRAEGPLVLTDPAGGVVMAESAALTPDLEQGLISSARLLVAGRMQLAAAEVRRTGGRYSTLYKTIASSCTICAENPTPTWALRASRITQDDVERRMYLENARLELFGRAGRLPAPALHPRARASSAPRASSSRASCSPTSTASASRRPTTTCSAPPPT